MVEQWNIDQAVTFLTESMKRHKGMLEGTKLSADSFSYQENVDIPSYNLGVVRSLALAVEVVKGMADRTQPPQRTLRDDVLSITRTLRADIGDLLRDLGDNIKYAHMDN